MKTSLKLILGALFGGQCLTATAISIDVTFDDPSRRYSSYYADIISHTNAAGNTWNRFINSDANFDVNISFSDTPTAAGHSVTSSYVRSNGPLHVFEQGAAVEARTGLDPNGAAADININLGSDYLLNDLWFDPRPYQRRALVPTDKIDAASVFLHEFGHALAFNGWRDGVDGSLPGDYQSTFDELVAAEGDNLFFTGEFATQVYGDKVPLTVGNYAHLGNNSSVGADLTSDLMNGVALNYGDRAFISRLDFAILVDTGVVVLPSADAAIEPLAPRLASAGPQSVAPASVVPLPGAAWLFATGLLYLTGLSRSKRVRDRQAGNTPQLN